MAGRIAYYGNIVSDGLVLCLDASRRESYPGFGTTAFDLSNIRTNASLLVSGTSTNPLPQHFNQRVTIGSNTTVRGMSQAGTVDMWIIFKINVSAFVQIWGETANPMYFYRNPGDPINTYSILSYFNPSGFVGVNTGTLSPNIWYNIVMTVNSNGQWAHYRNGVVLGSGTASNFTSWFAFSSTYYSGLFFNTDEFGTASLKMYNRFLTQQEVLQNYNALRGRFGL